jgi:energy-converting hydrogenase Eha subunit E
MEIGEKYTSKNHFSSTPPACKQNSPVVVVSVFGKKQQKKLPSARKNPLVTLLNSFISTTLTKCIILMFNKLLRVFLFTPF